MPVQTRSGGRTRTASPQKEKPARSRGRKKVRRSAVKKREESEKQDAEQAVEPKAEEKETEEIPAKKAKTEQEEAQRYSFNEGVIERGHVYFFYRPKVQHEEVHDIGDVGNFHMLLVPRPPEFSVHTVGETQGSSDQVDEGEMVLIPGGADVAPAAETKNTPRKHFRLITIGKKRLPDPDGPHGKEVFWASVTAIGDDLHSLEQGLGERSYQTKTRGERHQGPVRLAGRGVYAIVNSRGKTPSRNETHLAYHLSHPPAAEEVQEELGIHTASSFVVQVKNPEVEPGSFGQRIGLPAWKRAKYPEGIMKYVYEKNTKGRSYGLRFAPCSCIELLDYTGAELLLIAARSGVEGVDQSLGEKRGEVLKEVSERESQEPTEDIFRELGIEKDKFPAEPIEGQWI
ncbi:hypothetical protein SCLCIDRAFT_1207699 [Scleroderma citrinum Foug A]|uniref:Uncharacterized protein n=1 Tax=Scleroderma citrinum Foug A TaxID=1036808 RepID=A0A0C3ERA2_9AGAM|nr:hypothetical protein SCLCIDRAFT_1207699 [Scleroderma citrinum Foug A]